ncbi:MAG: hypothetical protein HY717_23930 [Planctomycetes bacterium]|nr:hypothetical protein [Planctomycetota bacterium]
MITFFYKASSYRSIRVALLSSLAVSALQGGSGPGLADGLAGGRLDWPALYQPLEDRQAEAFIQKALARGREWLGEPRIPVKRVRLRRSVPSRPDPSLPKGFRLTELNDSKAGLFTIYVSAGSEEQAFYGQLAHEAFHLFEPRFRDLYIEGLNTWLAARLLQELGLPWKPWEEHFRQGKDSPYSEAYQLMVELEKAVGEKALCALFRFREPQDRDPPAPLPGRPVTERAADLPSNRGLPEKAALDERWLRVSIDRWLESLPPDHRAAALKILRRHYSVLESARLRTHPDYSLEKPAISGEKSSPP